MEAKSLSRRVLDLRNSKKANLLKRSKQREGRS